MLRKELPLWEVGAGVVGGSVPDYPGSGHATFHTVPVPTAVYRGKRLRADEEGGVRARFYKTENWEFDISFGGQLPVDSDENAERKGMPDLDTMLELGPTFIWKIIKPSSSHPHKLILSVPLRFAISSDLKHWNTRGWIFNPILVYMRELKMVDNLTLFLGLDSKYASDTMMDYFYSVAPQFVRAGRPAYEANAGYLGTSLGLGMSYLFKNRYSFFGGVYQSNHYGTKNEDSPLFVKRNTTSVALGVVWWFWQSDRKGVQ